MSTFRLLSAALAFVAMAAHSGPAEPPSRDMQSLRRLLQSEAWPNTRFGGVPVTDESRKMVRDFLGDLFGDEAFIGATESWLKARGFTDEHQLQLEWLAEFGRMMTAGLAHWTDEEISFLLEGRLLGRTIMDPELCVKLSSPVITPQQAAALLRPRDGEIRSYLAILKRTYLLALANKVPKPRASESELSLATVRAYAAMPETERDLLLKTLGGQHKASVDEECAIGAAHLTALLKVEGQAGRLLRREYLIDAVSATFEAGPRPNVASEVLNSPSGDFQPGAASLHYPPLAVPAGIEGTMKVRIHVGADGLATRVETVEYRFNKDVVTLGDGSTLPAVGLFEQVASVYYQAGRFLKRYENGKPAPYQAVVELVWRLEIAEGLKALEMRVPNSRVLSTRIPEGWKPEAKLSAGVTHWQLTAGPDFKMLLIPVDPDAVPIKPTDASMREFLRDSFARYKDQIAEPHINIVDVPGFEGRGAYFGITDKSPVKPGEHKYIRMGFVRVGELFVTFVVHWNDNASGMLGPSFMVLQRMKPGSRPVP